MNKLIRLSNYSSVLCLLHCMTFPLLIAILPAIGLGFLLNHMTEVVMMSFAILASTVTLCWGFKQHRNLFPVALFVAGLLWYKVGHMSHHKILFLFVGILCFLGSNILNKRMCNSCHTCRSI